MGVMRTTLGVAALTLAAYWTRGGPSSDKTVTKPSARPAVQIGVDPQVELVLNKRDTRIDIGLTWLAPVKQATKRDDGIRRAHSKTKSLANALAESL